MPDALWWIRVSHHYLRVEPHKNSRRRHLRWQDHKTGQQDDTSACYRRLEERVTTIIPRVELTHRWSGQVIETPDGLPSSGRAPTTNTRLLDMPATLTFGTLAGVMISDAILGRSNPWGRAVRSGSEGLTRGLWDHVKENVDYPST